MSTSCTCPGQIEGEVGSEDVAHNIRALSVVEESRGVDGQVSGVKSARVGDSQCWDDDKHDQTDKSVDV